MDDREKSKEELSWELTALKVRLEKLEFIEAERGAAEQELRRSEERFRMAVECLDEGLLITDLDDVVLYVNSRISEMTGYAQDEMIGRPAYELILPSDQWPDLRQRNQQRSEGRSDCYEMEVVRKDGSRFWIESNAMPYLDGAGEVIGTLGAITDITQRKEAERQLQQSLEDKEVLLKEIHHRVKNNLQVISSLLDLQAQHFSDDRIRAAFTDSQNRIRSMALIHELLYSSTDLAQIDMGEYIQDLAMSLFSSYGDEISDVALQTDITSVVLDVDQAMPCGFIVNELVSNALKYAFVDGRKGVLFIGLSGGSGDSIEMVVRDNGVGLPPGFDCQQSTSLGLRLVHTLVQQLRGKLQMVGDGGVEFKVCFAITKNESK